LRVILPSETTPTQARYRRDLLVTAFTGGAGLLVAVTGVLAGGLFLAIGIAAAVILGATAVYFWLSAQEFARHKQTGNTIRDVLARHLSDEYVYFQNLSLPGQPSVGVIDGVLIGKHGATVIRLENARGNFIIIGDAWYKAGGEVTKTAVKPLAAEVPPEENLPPARFRLDHSPTWLAIRAAREVKAWLSVRGLPQISVHPLVVVGDQTNSELRKPSATVIRLGELENYIHDMLLTEAAEDKLSLAEGVVEQIAHRLQTTNAEQIQPKLTESV
jgi:hypothetical protein